MILSVRLAAAAALQATLLGCVPLHGQASHVLHFEEALAWSVPDSFQLAGISASPGGSLVLWGGPNLILLEGPDWEVSTSRSLDVQQLVGAFAVADTVVEVVDGPAGQLLRLSRTGRVLARELLGGAPLPVETAVLCAGEWFVGGRTADGDYEVRRVIAGAKTQWLAAIPAEGERLSAYLSCEKRGLLVSFLNAPFAVYRINSGGRLDPLWHTRFGSTQKFLSGSDEAYWVASPPIPLEPGYLQTFADLRSDSRVLRVHDHAGSVVREKLVQVPLRFVTHVPGRPVFLAVRRTDRLEVVAFRWRRSPLPHSGEISW